MQEIVDLRVSGLDNTTTVLAWCLDPDGVTAVDTTGWTLTALGADEGRYLLSVPLAAYGSTFEIYETANRANYSIGELTQAVAPLFTPVIVSSVAPTLTVAEMIQDALENLGVHDPGETLSPEEGNTGLRKLNLLLDSMSIDKGKIFMLTEETFVLVSGTGSYSVGPGMTWNTVLPTDIVQAFLRDTTVTPNYDIPLRVNMTQAEYNAIPYKDTAGRPNAILYAPGTGSVRTVYFDYLPDKAYSFLMFSIKPLTAIGAITDGLLLPPGYQAFLTAALTIALSSPFSRAVPAAVVAEYNRLEHMIDAQNGSTPPTWQDMTQPPTMNWGRGGGGRSFSDGSGRLN